MGSTPDPLGELVDVFRAQLGDADAGTDGAGLRRALDAVARTVNGRWLDMFPPGALMCGCGDIVDTDYQCANCDTADWAAHGGAPVVPSGPGPVEVTVTGYMVSRLADTDPDQETWGVRVEAAGNGAWAVRHHRRCLSTSGTWDWEPSPSHRDASWLAEHRWDDASSAVAAAIAAEPHLVVNGLSPEDVRRRHETGPGASPGTGCDGSDAENNADPAAAGDTIDGEPASTAAAEGAGFPSQDHGDDDR